MPLQSQGGSTATSTKTPPFPPLTRSSTLPANIPKLRPNTGDRSLLTPEDAYATFSPPHLQTAGSGRLQRDLRMTNAGGSESRDISRGRNKIRNKDRGGSASRIRKGTWKKLLWVKQSYPDNYTDQETFLEHLQRNPRLQPYDFWPLVADSTVIVQHVCSVVIFVVCFTGIFQERVSPVAIVGWGTAGTVLGWVLWDFWVRQEEALAEAGTESNVSGSKPATNFSLLTEDFSSLDLSRSNHGHSASASSITSLASVESPVKANHTPYSPYGVGSSFSPRNQQRLATAKSAVLIYCALLGLSPILKSLTKSTSSDSIWAMSAWLMIINVFFFDYGGGVGVKFPASLSTNAALMASTMLASRLPSTEHVFSLTLFSIEVFGLFPVFRRHLRHESWKGHLALTAVLVMGAGGGVGVVVSRGGWKAALVGITLGNILTGLAMGGCSMWLIGLQKYKNEIHGPWDPARPVIRRRYDD